MWKSVAALVVMLIGVHCQDMVTVMPSEEGVEEGVNNTPALEKVQVKPTIRSLHISSDVTYRYATTLVSTRVVNTANHSGEATFTVTLPESAFISQFLMEIKDKVYKAYVKEKEEAKAIYQGAVQAGQFAGHVALDARDSNQFTVSVNIEAHGKVTFNLTYEQLLARNLGVYSNVININPQQIVEDMSVSVNITEPSRIINLEVPELQLSNEAVPDKHNDDAKIEEISPNHKRVTWTPTPEQQKNINSTGLSGQFIVKYDVDRSENPSQIIVDEGYFVHFFAPENLPQLRKHVIFVLDFSGSMSGQKLSQLKESMKQIFSDLSPKDYFSIVIFHSWVEVWSPNGMFITSRPEYFSSWESQHMEKIKKVDSLTNQFVVEATPANIEQARTFMEDYSDLGSTNIIGGLRTGLRLVDIGEEMWANESDPPQPVLVFLTDGQPNIEEYDPDVIITKTKALNVKKSPIFSLAFGYGADFNFLRKLSLQNFGFARNIYEAADATQQLKNFYKTISSPLLSNVTFSYLPGQVDNSTSTKQEFPVFFKGGELVVAGQVNDEDTTEDKVVGELSGMSATGPMVYPIVLNLTMLKPQNYSIGHLEKSWSYLTIQQLLDKSDSLDDGKEKNETKKRALDLALKYAFVTPLTSLVVVKPNETESSVDATKIKPGLDFPEYASPALFQGVGLSGARPMMASAVPAMAPSGMYSAKAMIRTPISTRLSAVGGGGYAGYAGAAPSTPHILTPGGALGPAHPDWNNFYSEDSQLVESEANTTVQDVPSKVSLWDIVWLQQTLNETKTSGYGTVTIEGKDYKVGLNETTTTFGDCKVANTDGQRVHIQHCPLDVFQEYITEFLPYMATLPEDFLGVCCPNSLLLRLGIISLEL